MSFNIVLMQNMSEDNNARKILNNVTTLTGNLKEECSIIDPIILIDLTGLDVDISEVNYCYIEVYGRYYFIQNIECVRGTKLYRLKCHVDVLQSFYSQYADCYGITQRQESRWNLYLNDGSLKVYQQRPFDTFNFSSGFNSWSYVLLVAGGVASS